MAKKIFYSLLSLILAAAIVFVGCFFGIPEFNAMVRNAINPNIENDKTGGTIIQPDNSGTNNISSAGGAIISDIKCNGGISLLSALLPREAYAANGIDAQAETAFTLNATITPSSADDKRVVWTVTDKSGTLNASDYITLNASGLTAKIACKQEFDHQFTVTVKSLDNPNATATCTLDYVQKITGITVNMPKMNSTSTAVTYEIEGSKYTIKADYNVSFSNFQMRANFVNELNENMYGEDYPLCESLHPNYTSQLVRYTSTGVEFTNGASLPASGIFNHCIDGIVGCFVRHSSQRISEFGETDGDMINYFRSLISDNYIATVDITASAAYGGNTYNTVRQTLQIWIDGASLHIPVTGISLDNSSILF